MPNTNNTHTHIYTPHHRFAFQRMNSIAQVPPSAPKLRPIVAMTNVPFLLLTSTKKDTPLKSSLFAQHDLSLHMVAKRNRNDLFEKNFKKTCLLKPH